MKTASYIHSIEYYLPDSLLSNQILSSEHPEWSVDKIASKTGINNRHIAADNEYSSDMAVKAANILFERNDINKNKIDYLLLCTQSPDYFLPTTACIVQDRLQLNKAIGALDFNLGCSGFVYGLGLAKGLIETGQAKNVLLITSETYSKYLHPKDRSNRTLFGDAAAATLVSSISDTDQKISNFSYLTDGGGSEFLIVKNGAMRNRHEKGEDNFSEDLFRNDDYLYMNGKEIFSFTVFNIPQLMFEACRANELSMDDIDLFILHQANDFMLQTIRKKANIPTEKFYTYLSECGNTVSSTIPIALHHAIKDGKVKKGSKVLLAGFGVGLSAAATVVKF